MNWCEFIQTLTSEYRFFPPTNIERLSTAEDALGVALPSELKELLQQSDGINGEYSLALVWALERIQSDNLRFRTYPDFRELYMPFDPLLFFADAGNGDQFAFAIRGGQIRSTDIYVWNHEDDSRTWVAPSLDKYLEWWLSRKIEI